MGFRVLPVRAGRNSTPVSEWVPGCVHHSATTACVQCERTFHRKNASPDSRDADVHCGREMKMLDGQTLAFIVVTAIPGVDTMLVVRNVVRGGRRHGVLAPLWHKLRRICACVAIGTHPVDVFGECLSSHQAHGSGGPGVDALMEGESFCRSSRRIPEWSASYCGGRLGRRSRRHNSDFIGQHHVDATRSGASAYTCSASHGPALDGWLSERPRLR